MLSHLPWEQALGLDGIDPLSSPAVKDRWTKTSAAVPDNGLNPQWSQVNFACAVWSPEQTLLKVSIYNSKSSLLGKGSKVLLAYAMVPVCALRNGFRSLPLRSPLGCPIEVRGRARTRARARGRARMVSVRARARVRVY